MAIDPRALKTYLAVCRTNSISGAARLLNLSQPSVSTIIAKLESALGAKLFDRGRAGIVLTLQGEILERRALAIEAMLHDTEQEVRLIDKGVEGPLRIGGTPGALLSLMPHVVRMLEDSGAHYAMRIIEQSEAELSELLRAGEIDFAIVTTEIGEPQREFEEKTLFRDPFTLMAGRRNDDLPDEIDLVDTTFLPWVMPEAAGGFRRQIDALFIASRAPLPRNVIRSDSLLTTKAIVRSGKHVTILPNEVAAVEMESGELRSIRIKGVPLKRSIGIRTVKQVYGRSAIAERVIQILFSKSMNAPVSAADQIDPSKST